jgi:hypothetical protein
MPAAIRASINVGSRSRIDVSEMREVRPDLSVSYRSSCSFRSSILPSSAGAGGDGGGGRLLEAAELGTGDLVLPFVGDHVSSPKSMATMPFASPVFLSI